MERIIPSSPDLTDQNIRRLGDLFPAVLTETVDSDGNTKAAIDLDLLRQELSGHLIEGDRERFQLDWPGKREALIRANTPTTKTLRPNRSDSFDFDHTKNLFIEGDNLEALKLLQESYLGKVKLIYLDPPYNTGNDFIYVDNFKTTKAEYLEDSGQKDHAGNRLRANLESNGRFHSDWLSMMYPRLRLARRMMRTDGVIMISIDENEISSLIAICDEVFGPGNRMGIFVWERKKKPSFLRKSMGLVTEFIVAYARNYDEVGPLVSGAGEAGKKYPLNNAGNSLGRLVFQPKTVSFGIPDGTIDAQDMSQGNIRTVLVEPVTIQDGTNLNELVLDGEWRYSQTKLDELVAAGGEIRISKIPFRPNYINYEDRLKKTSNLLSHRVNSIPTNEDATAEMRDLFGSDVMDFPKPIGLLKYLIASCTSDDDLVLDFFAGSGTVGHAVMSLNCEDGGNRRYILVQLAENCSDQSEAAKAGFRTVADVAKERLRRAGAKIQHKADGACATDIGFRVFCVDESSFVDHSKAPDDEQQADLDLSVTNVRSDRSSGDLIAELLLNLGLPLDLSFAVLEVEGTELYVIEDGLLVACFRDDLDPSLVKHIASMDAERVVFRDSAFASDADRINVDQIFAEVSPATEVKVI